MEEEGASGDGVGGGVGVLYQDKLYIHMYLFVLNVHLYFTQTLYLSIRWFVVYFVGICVDVK